jgi:hypothetical protein
MLKNLVVAGVVGAIGLADIGVSHGQDDNEDVDFLSDLSLEELLNIRLTKRGVLGIHHAHPKGEWMFSLHTMYMSMDGNRDGSNDLSKMDVLAG